MSRIEISPTGREEDNSSVEADVQEKPTEKIFEKMTNEEKVEWFKEKIDILNVESEDLPQALAQVGLEKFGGERGLKKEAGWWDKIATWNSNRQVKVTGLAERLINKEVEKLQNGAGREVWEIKEKLAEHNKVSEKNLKEFEKISNPDKVAEIREKIKEERENLEEKLNAKAEVLNDELEEHPAFEKQEKLGEFISKYSEIYKKITAQQKDFNKKIKLYESSLNKFKGEYGSAEDMREETADKLRKLNENLEIINSRAEKTKERLDILKEDKKEIDSMVQKLNTMGKTKKEIAQEKKKKTESETEPIEGQEVQEETVEEKSEKEGEPLTMSKKEWVNQFKGFFGEDNSKEFNNLFENVGQNEQVEEGTIFDLLIMLFLKVFGKDLGGELIKSKIGSIKGEKSKEIPSESELNKEGEAGISMFKQEWYHVFKKFFIAPPDAAKQYDDCFDSLEEGQLSEEQIITALEDLFAQRMFLYKSKSISKARELMETTIDNFRHQKEEKPGGRVKKLLKVEINNEEFSTSSSESEPKNGFMPNLSSMFKKVFKNKETKEGIEMKKEEWYNVFQKFFQASNDKEEYDKCFEDIKWERPLTEGQIILKLEGLLAERVYQGEDDPINMARNLLKNTIDDLKKKKPNNLNSEGKALKPPIPPTEPPTGFPINKEKKEGVLEMSKEDWIRGFKGFSSKRVPIQCDDVFKGVTNGAILNENEVFQLFNPLLKDKSVDGYDLLIKIKNIKKRRNTQTPSKIEPSNNGEVTMEDIERKLAKIQEEMNKTVDIDAEMRTYLGGRGMGKKDIDDTMKKLTLGGESDVGSEKFESFMMPLD